MLRPTTIITAILATAPATAAPDLADCRISAGPGAPSIAARCTDFERPLDPADPDGPTITLRVAVVPALSLEPASDAFVPIAGGPGGSSIRFYAGWANAFERVRQTRDILVVDQRGTGDSAPLTCAVDDDIVEGVYTPEDTLRATRECLAGLPYDPRFFTTSVAVADLEAVRKALGYASLDLYGSSYGTRVAQHYARRYPATTRTVVVDGVVPPQVPLGPEIAIESQRALDRVLDRCADDPKCGERFPAIHEDFGRLREALADGPVAVSLPDPVTAEMESMDFGPDHMAAAVRLMLYDARTIALLPFLIHSAAEGDYRPLAAQFQMTVAALSDELSVGMHNAVVCTEDVPFVDEAGIDRDALENSYLGPGQYDALSTICSVWPAGPMDDDLLTPLAGPTPVLLLSGDADPITPPRYADLAAVDLEHKWALTGTNQGHGLGAVGCVPRIVGAFVESATLEDGAADCLGDAFAMPFYLDASGPAP